MTAVVLRGDAAHLPLPDASVDLIVTSPPYFGLRSYTDGGEHYQGQIGSEATPAEFVAALIACTREWVRVLKPSGSLFVNLGDSYASQPAGKQGSNGQVNGSGPAAAHAARRGERNRRPTGGRQMTREDAAWLAGVIDSDGSVSVHINQQAEGRSPSFVAWVRVGQMRPEVVTRIAEIVGTGQVMQDTRGVWSWTAAAQQARWVLERIHPWLLIKKRQAWAAIEVARHVEDRNARGAWRPLTADDVAYRQRLREAVLAWNKGRPDDMPVPEPRPVVLPVYPFGPAAKSLLGIPWQYANACTDQLGLILRAEIVWAKPNGLPESVTDRVRRSHEQLFHFTVRPRYFAAVDEIREATGTYTSKSWADRKTLGEGPRQGEQRAPTASMLTANPLGKLPGSVWTIPSAPLKVPAHLGIDHFAAFPPALVRPIVLGWSPAGICTACGEGRRPVVDRTAVPHWKGGSIGTDALQGDLGGMRFGNGASRFNYETTVTGYACACTSNVSRPGDARVARPGISPALVNPSAGASATGTGPGHLPPTRPAVVLDPFGGTGTTALVATVHGRTGITVDMSADYCRLAAWRTHDPAERARALDVPKPPPVPDGMEPLFAI